MARWRNGRARAVATATAPVRCAIYTRKSTDEGLDSNFSTLDAQRESAELYIQSQQQEGVGWLTSGGWGYTVATNIGYGYVRNKDGVDDAFLAEGDYELEVATERLPCRIRRGPLYDPKMARIKM